MSTGVIIILIVVCVAVVVAIVALLGRGIVLDKQWREGIARYNANRRARRGRNLRGSGRPPARN
jgi:hypothetical protein